MSLCRSLSDLMCNNSFTALDRAKLCTAASELAQNALQHGGGGEAEITLSELHEALAVTVTVRDSGPGIANLDLAMTPGYSTGGTSGLGLSGARNLADEFKIFTSHDQGTSVTVVKLSVK